MIHHRILLMAGIAALIVPGAVQANEVSQRVDIGATVTGACGMGSPGTTEINLGTLNDSQGKLKASLASASIVSGSTYIADAWCNAPHKLSIKATPMVLEDTPGYSQPAYMSRRLTYQATLQNWVAGQGIGIRPLGGSDTGTSTFTEARAAVAPGLKLEISDLETLSGESGVGTETPGLMLETSQSGLYRGTVTITLATNP
ncbi:hypothetical protein [Sphingopyxis sp.]|uniref:hypothetical protein n=1 Tax=Sphingopyxis sp. TaxID=1908224 RepID=UPI0026319A85|nr:hypothetical protein [Sphingopyxis sp.]MCW0196764.1 hypothetical protein [Sphingopyxis sp.]